MHFPHASNDFKKLNPAIFGRQPVAGVPNPERKSVPLQALDKGKKAQRRSESGMATLCIRIISLRSREADLDNVIAGAKPIRDAIARSLSFNDGDKRVVWEYDTCVTRGQSGTQIIISQYGTHLS